MLLEFRAENFKSFKDEMIFTMTPAPKIQDLKYSVMKTKIGSNEYKVLPSAVIYGPNAAGKTNIIGAIEVLKKILIRGNIYNSKDNNQNNMAAQKLELIPNINADKDEALKYKIKFIHNGMCFEYEIHITLGMFMNLDYSRKIKFEELIINNKRIYTRSDELNFTEEIKGFEKFFITEFNRDTSLAIAKSNLKEDEIFLTTYFKTIFSGELFNIMKDWFENKLVVIYSANFLESKPDITDDGHEEGVYVSDRMNQALRKFGICGKEIGYMKGEDSEFTPVSIVMPDNAGIRVIQSEIFESYGTMRFLNIFPIVARAIEKGQTLIVDELDASIHPIAIMSIINVFHNDEINKKGAQLIFNTHNPIFLNSDVFRRDEIKFVERDKESNSSCHYSLSDFGTSGERSVRNHENYLKNYFISKYGAIEDINFTDLFLNEKEHNDEGEI